MKEQPTSTGTYIASALLVLFFVQAIVTNGFFGGIGDVMKVSFIASYVIATLFMSTKYPRYVAGFVMVVGGSFAWFFWSGTIPGRVWQDLIVDLIVIVVCLFFVEWLFLKFKIEDDTGQTRQAFAWALVSWFVISLVDWARPHALPMQPDRFASLPAAQWDWNTEVQTGLSLSGGGYRAAIFHSGVLAALDELGIRIDTLSTVSGGAIIGAYYQRGGLPALFPEAITRGKFSLKRELLRFPNNPLVILPARVPFTDVELVPWLRYSRLDVQASLLRRLYKKGGQTAHPAAPRLVINTTDLSYGFKVAFLESGVMLWAPHEPPLYFAQTDEFFQPDASFDLARQVAISGGFPGAFPPTEYPVYLRTMNPESLVVDGRQLRKLSLVDGGVVDNLGADMLVALNQAIASYGTLGPARSLHSDVILVSDAGALFAVDNPTTSLAATARAFDVAQLQKKEIANQEEEYRDKRVVFSAKDNFEDVQQHFLQSIDLNDSADTSCSGHSAKRIGTRVDIDLYALPEELLAGLIDLLPAPCKALAQSLLPQVLTAKSAYERADEPARSRLRRRQNQPAPAICAQAPAGPQCAPVLMHLYLRDGISQYLAVFRGASTLRDHFRHDDAQALHDLGKALVYLQFPRLANILQASRTQP